MDITVILITSAPSLAACPSVGLATGVISVDITPAWIYAAASRLCSLTYPRLLSRKFSPPPREVASRLMRAATPDIRVTRGGKRIKSGP
ncbi:hypothetical protein RRG08_064987 [Elysia crispata]|uniref:Uncharacterized protein n=1 Tax=Elysia crispata TaxID=231223 RepID=A0AAE1CVI8_9GAST|nr:hypothetical protein RRG08_064987 [Elysia crispata]